MQLLVGRFEVGDQSGGHLDVGDVQAIGDHSREHRVVRVGLMHHEIDELRNERGEVLTSEIGENAQLLLQLLLVVRPAGARDLDLQTRIGLDRLAARRVDRQDENRERDGRQLHGGGQRSMWASSGRRTPLRTFDVVVDAAVDEAAAPRLVLTFTSTSAPATELPRSRMSCRW